MSKGASTGLVDATPGGSLEPVQEQGTGLALDGLERLAEEENTAQYSTAQNRLTRGLSASGTTIDYTITLLRFNEDNQGQSGHGHPFSANHHLRIGGSPSRGLPLALPIYRVPAKTPSKSSC